MIYKTQRDQKSRSFSEDLFVLTGSGEVLRLLEADQKGGYYQDLGSSDKRFISTEKLREGVALNWEILTGGVEAEAIAVVSQFI